MDVTEVSETSPHRSLQTMGVPVALLMPIRVDFAARRWR
jgi:hypothetical protein